MQKSTKRIQLESEITQAHNDSLAIAMRMVKDEFNENLEKALSDASFVSRMQSQVRQAWRVYREGYKRLEDLEKKEGHPAITACANVIDEIAGYLPNINKKVCHYPFSGVDFYWARIFDRIVFEDSGFDQYELPTMWWDPRTYSSEKRQEIITTLKAQKIIPESAILEFVNRDSAIPKSDNKFNNSITTLLVKGGHDFLGYVKSRFGNTSLEYGAIITVTATNPLGDIEKRLKRDGYNRIASLVGTNFLIPYAMELKDIHIFLR